MDIDLEKFFDRVNHDILMSRIARKVKDKRVLRVICCYLQVGMMQDGLTSQRVEGTPQGRPLSPLLSNIFLKVNPAKSGVDRPWKRKFLGYSMTMEKATRLRPSPQNVQRLRDKIREMMRRGRGWRLGRLVSELAPKLRGWGNYFCLSEVKQVFEELDTWIRRRLRNVLWRQWKTPKTRLKELRKRGLPDHLSKS